MVLLFQGDFPVHFLKNGGIRFRRFCEIEFSVYNTRLLSFSTVVLFLCNRSYVVVIRFSAITQSYLKYDPDEVKHLLIPNAEDILLEH